MVLTSAVGALYIRHITVGGHDPVIRNELLSSEPPDVADHVGYVLLLIFATPTQYTCGKVYQISLLSLLLLATNPEHRHAVTHG